MRSAWLGASVLLCVLNCAREEPVQPRASQPERARVPSAITLSDEAIQNSEIRTARVDRTAMAPRLAAMATLEADPQHIARIGAHVTGRIASIDVKLGDRVKAGQALMQIDTVETHLVSSEYLTAAARAREAKDALERQRQLVNERIGAMQDLRRAEANAEATTAALNEAEEHLHFLGLSDHAVGDIRSGTTRTAGRSVLRATISGRIALLSASLGQVVSGTEDILTIVDADELWAVLRVYERDLGDLAIGANVQIRVATYAEQVFPAIIALTGETVDPVTRTVEVRAKLDNTDGKLKPGMTAEASIELRPSRNQLWLPAEAVQPRGTERMVFVPLDPHRFTPRVVSVGAERGGFIPIMSGLAEGDQVVVHGAFALRGELERVDFEGD
jgi:cobalt-zinc-cadmium efflux system membrane fusion protein